METSEAAVRRPFKRPFARTWLAAFALAIVAQATVGCGYVKLAKKSLVPVPVPAVPTATVVLPGAMFVSASTVNALTTPTGYKVTSELGVSVGSVTVVTAGAYTVYQSAQAASYSP